MSITEFTIENLEKKIQECQKKIVINRKLMREGQLSGHTNPKINDEVKRLKKQIIYYQRELSKKYREKYPEERYYPEDIEHTKLYF